MKQYWRCETLPFIAHDRCRWVELDLECGQVCNLEAGEEAHPYIEMLAQALHKKAPPFRELPELPSLLAMPSPTRTSRPAGQTDPRAVTALNATHASGSTKMQDKVVTQGLDPFGGAKTYGSPEAVEVESGVFEVINDGQVSKLFGQGIISFAAMLQAKKELQGADLKAKHLKVFQPLRFTIFFVFWPDNMQG